MSKPDRKSLQTAYKERKITGGVFMIKNTVTGRLLLMSSVDLPNSRNRFEFSRKMDTCTHLKLQADWQQYGAAAFAYEVLEELERLDGQTDREFSQDVKTLYEMWLNRLAGENLY